jgi:PTS system nitrogen regulatory IIA component
MNTLLDIFTTDCIVINSPVRNKAEAFAAAGDLFKSRLGISSRAVIDCLNTREDLSSTALGSGVGIPHGIVDGIQTPVGCLIKLAGAIDFAAPDRDKINILIILLFPKIPTYEQLQVLSYLAQRLLDVGVRGKIISEQRPEKICQLLNLAIDFDEKLKTQESHSGFKQYMTSSNQDIQDYLDEWAMLEHYSSQNTH